MSPSEFYDQVNDDYLYWSKNLNIHFGYFRWPNLTHLFSNEKMLEEMNRQVMAKLGVSKEIKATVLDAGCGIGTTCIQISHELLGVTFYGVNISQKQISCGNKLIHQQKLQERIKLLQVDFTNVPMKGGSFDAAYAIESACYDRGFDKKGFVVEMARLLKAGGRLVVADGFRKNSKQLPSWMEKMHRQNLEYWSMDELADIRLFIERMKEWGFVEIEAREISWNVAPSAAYLPSVAVGLAFQRLFSKKSLSVHQKNYPKAIWLTLLLGLFRRHFGYYLICAKKRQ